jgi:NADH dehydrogenase [ubiquinone] 1 alpha subcomplex assembly factor 7
LQVNVEWLSSVDQLKPRGASIVLANEYLDTRGVSQYELHDGKVYERTVELDAAGNFSYGLKRVPESYEIERLQREHGSLSDGTILETQPNYQPTEAMRHLSTGGALAALFIDYGSTSFPEFSIGDTLQAVRNHRYEHPLTSPGEADLTNQVNFTEFAQNALDQGLAVDGPVTQAEFLGRLGIVERASKLMSANPAKAAEIESGVARLIAPGGMGTRFKAIGIRSRQLPPLPGF